MTDPGRFDEFERRAAAMRFLLDPQLPVIIALRLTQAVLCAVEEWAEAEGLDASLAGVAKPWDESTQGQLLQCVELLACRQASPRFGSRLADVVIDELRGQRLALPPSISCDPRILPTPVDYSKRWSALYLGREA